MNTDTTDNSGNELQGAFGDRGTNVNSMAYGHPNGQKIIDDCCEVLRQCETGRMLLVFYDKKQVPVHIMKGKGDSGFSPDMGTIIMQVPGNVKEMQPEHVIYLAKALHEAGQELAGFKAPEPGKDLIAYASFIHGRNLDSMTEVCQMVKELTNSSYFSVLLDSLTKLGFNDFYKAYLNGASRDELYTHYANAYETI